MMRDRFYLVIIRKAMPEFAYTIRLVDLTYRSFLAYSVNE
jgi:hypothetical protein